MAVNKGLKKFKNTLAVLSAEMALPAITASAFTALHKSSSQLDFTKLLPDVVTIADEVDAQLKQQTVCYMAANAV